MASSKFRLEEIESNHYDYIRIKQMVENAKSKRLIVTRIYRVKNEILEKRYQEALDRTRKQFPNFKEELLLHGTSGNKIVSICTNGLDPRLCVDKELGQVVYLTESSAFASNFPPDVIVDVDRNMFGCMVSIGNVLDVTRIPNQSWRDIIEGYDTKLKPLGNFQYGNVGKWQADEVFPKFLIKYKITLA